MELRAGDAPHAADGRGLRRARRLDVWNNGTFTVRKLNFRFEVQFGPDFARNWPFNDLKFIIVHTADTLGGNTNNRPMCNWANADMPGMPGILAWAVGAGTVKNFNPVGQAPAFAPPSQEDFYLGPAAGTFRGKPLIPPSEWLSIEVEIVAESTTANPNGRIRSIIHRRGVPTPLTEVSIPWNYDSSWSLPRFISEVQVLGGYFNTGTIASMPGNHYRIANYITFAANRPGLLGPRADFVQ